MDRVLVLPSCTQFREQRLDFGAYAGSKIETIVDSAIKTLRVELESGEYSTATIAVIVGTFRADLLPWLLAAAAATDRSLGLEDIDKALLEAFAADLRLANTYGTASGKFGAALMLLRSMSRLGYLPPFAEIRPAVQFPGVQCAQTPTRPYSKRERDELLRALASDFRDIRDGTHLSIVPGSKDSLAVALLLLALPTGLNLTPLLEIGRDALREHPLRKNEWMLVAYKRRGNKELVARAKWSDEIAAMRSLDLHLVPVYRQAAQWSEQSANTADVKYRNLVFVRPPLANGPGASNTPVPLTTQDFNSAVAKLNTRYAIQGDDGNALTISTRRIRATLAARIYDLSDGDPFVVARVLGNLPKTTALHYLEPEFGAPATFAKAVQEFSERIQQAVGNAAEATPVGGCSDPLHGRFAPKDGITYCQRWLHCFQCPNQCITADESALWRLYSFYWLLLEKGPALRRLRLSGQVRFVLHVIDSVVTERFGAVAVKAKERARNRPHPIWASADTMGALAKEAPDV
jgi:hypothetical protein